MLKTAEFSISMTGERDSVPLPAYKVSGYEPEQRTRSLAWFRQVLRFALVGGLNTCIDLLVLNCLLWLFPTTHTSILLLYNALAFSLGAINSFLLNKYWTFGQRQGTTWREIVRFSLVTLAGIAWSSCVIWLASTALHTNAWLAQPRNALLWANASKVIAIVSSALLSYLTMRLWVFVRGARREQPFRPPVQASPVRIGPSMQLPLETTQMPVETPIQGTRSSSLPSHAPANKNEGPTSDYWVYGNEPYRSHSLSVVLPVYNEEAAIASTIRHIVATLPAMISDFEIIAVDDGSTDRSPVILAVLCQQVPQLRVITHAQNQGYGAALADGFAAASRELTFFMDADGQFDIEDLYGLLTCIDQYDAVIGYRLVRQDTTMRKLNAWGWHVLIGLVLHVHACDIDCAFKLFRTSFLHRYAPETRGAMINAEMLYKLTRAGYTYQEIGVNHLPRRAGKATGARPRVIARALRELFYYAHRWRNQEILPNPSSIKKSA